MSDSAERTTEPGHRLVGGRLRLSTLPAYLVRLAPVQIALVACGVALIGAGFLLHRSLNRSVAHLAADGDCVYAHVVDVLWEPLMFPSRVRLEYEAGHGMRRVDAWTAMASERLTPAAAQAGAVAEGDAVRICVDSSDPAYFATPRGTTVSSALTLPFVWYIVLTIGTFPIVASLSMSIIAWRGDEPLGRRTGRPQHAVSARFSFAFRRNRSSWED